MAYIVEMPKLSDTMEEGGIAHWLKKEGDTLKVGEPLVEIETDKATQEYEAPEDGYLIKILVQAGKTVGLRTPIAVIGDKDEVFDPKTLPALPKGTGAAQAPTPAASSPAPVAVPPAPATPPSPKVVESAPGDLATGSRIKSSPLARRMAQDLGIDLGRVGGSGPGGRIVARDLEGAASTDSSGTFTGGLASIGTGPVIQQASATEVPVNMMRKTIAKRLVAAKNEAPHFYLKVSADVGPLLAWRQRLNQGAGAGGAGGAETGGKAGLKVSVNDIIGLAVSRALLLHPMVNASWQGETILMHHQVHLALAVALPNGLVTPVIRNAHLLGVKALATEAQRLVALAREGKLANDAFAGGTFSLSNLGMFGIEEFTAIINPPQAAILAVGAAIPTPWVGADGQIKVSQRLNLTLSCDHRVVDGATGAQFLKTLVGYLEDPLLILA